MCIQIVQVLKTRESKLVNLLYTQMNESLSDRILGPEGNLLSRERCLEMEKDHQADYLLCHIPMHSCHFLWAKMFTF